MILMLCWCEFSIDFNVIIVIIVWTPAEIALNSLCAEVMWIIKVF